MKHNRLSIFFTLLAIWIAAVAGTPAEDFAAALNPSQCAMMVVDLKADTVVTMHNADTPLTPASITKSVTIASTLLKSGSDYKYHTRLYATGKIHDGVLQGNLLVVGGGDPALGADVEPKGTDILSEAVTALRTHGVRRIEGKIITDESIFPGPATHPTWGSGDISRSYGTGCHGINFRRNASGKCAVTNPAATLVNVLTNTFTSAGIEIAGGELDSNGKHKLLLDHVSPPISEIMRSCMMRSDNLYAETLLRTLALLHKKVATTQEGADIEAALWKKKGAPMEGVNIVDGSGLSRSNRLTARFLAYVLRQMADNEIYASFFPLAGQEGTVRRLFKNTPLDSYVALKTGTMRGVRCLAGYMLDEQFAPTHAIVIISNNAPGGASSVNAATERLLMRLFYQSES